MHGSVSLDRAAPRLVVTLIAASTSCLLLMACFHFDRPSGLEQVGVRAGAEWLIRETTYQDTRLESITQIVNRTNGELAILGTGGAVFLPAEGGVSRFVPFREPAGRAELLEWKDEPPRYLDRGGGGWQTGALLAEDGRRLWQPNPLNGMDDLAAGDLDGDGVPEFVVGYNGDGGLHRLDATGRPVWQAEDGNVWHVEIVDTDGDGKAEIVHSNAGGELTVREPDGRVRWRTKPTGYLSAFSIVQWPPGQTGILHAGDGVTEIIDFHGRTRVSLATPDSSFLVDAYGASVRFGAEDFLVLALSGANWERTQLLVFDRVGTLRYREVVAGDCVAVAGPEPDSFLFGWGASVIRYRARP